MAGKPVLGCLLCKHRFSRQDIADGLYWPQTYICSSCYARLQQAPLDVSCFGKWTEVDAYTGHQHLGYDAKALECRKVCPDREVCKKVFE